MQVDLHPWYLDTLVLLEAIEHISPQRLEGLERKLFNQCHARQILISTPNADYNALLGLSPGQFRHPDHKFEWGRSRFQDWANSVALRGGFAVEFEGIGRSDDVAGSPSQVAVFIRSNQSGETATVE